MNDDLNVVVEGSHWVLRQSARALNRAWQGVGGRRVRLGRPGDTPSGPLVRLGLGSLVRPSVTVRFAVPYAPKAAADAERLALTTAAWDTLGDAEVWRALSAPLAPIPRWGRPDWDRPWVVAFGGRRPLPEAALHDGAQLHVIGGWRPPPRRAVWWPTLPGAAAAVLGRAAGVIGDRDPLVYDAIRADVPLRARAAAAARGAGSPDDALAGLVPPSLAGELRLWRHVARTARAVHETGFVPSPLMTPAWVLLGRERIRVQLASPQSGWERLRRRHDKLRRDPRAFFNDSRYAPLRALGRVVYSRR